MRLAVEEFAARRIWGNCGTRRWNSSRVQERTLRRPRLDASLTSYYPRVGITVGITHRNTPPERVPLTGHQEREGARGHD